MNSAVRLITCGAVALAMMTVSAFADSPSPQEARKAERQLRGSNKSLADIVSIAEKETGGKAISVELVHAYEWEHLNRNRQNQNQKQNFNDQNPQNKNSQVNQNNKDRNSQTTNNDDQANRDEIDRDDEPLDRDDGNDEEFDRDENDQSTNARNDRNIDRSKFAGNNRDRDQFSQDRDKLDFRVTCLVNRSKLQDVYVCPKSGQVLLTSNSNRFSNQRDFYRNNRGRSDDRYARVDDSYIEHNSWPPRRGDQLRDEYEAGQRPMRYSNSDRYRNDREYYNDDYDRNRRNDDYGRNDRYARNNDQYDRYDRDNNRYGRDDMNNRNGRRGNMNGPGQPELASQILNVSAVSPQGRDLGDVDDIAIDPVSHDVVYLAVARGGFLGIGQKMIAVPCDAVLSYTPTRARIDVEPSDLKKEKGFDKSNWPKEADASLSSGAETKRAAQIAKVSELYGKKLFNTQNEPLGEIEDLVIDIDAAKVAYVMIDCKDGIVAVPASALEHRGDKCVVNIAKDQFTAMPKYKAGNYPNFTSRTWGNGVHRDFNVKPYWVAQSANATGAASVGSARVTMTENQ